MYLLESYIFGRVLRMFLSALVPVLAIIWSTQVLGRINLVTDSGQSIGSFALLATYILPNIIPVVLPFAVVIGVTQTLHAMNNDSELPVIDAAGAPRGILYRPIIALSAILCIASFSIDNFIEPVTRLGMRKTIAATYADLLSSVIEEKAFRKLDDGLYVQISERVKGRVLKGLFVADSRDPRYEMLYYAREGAVDPKGGTLIMKDGEIHRKAPQGSASIIHFDSYSFDLSDLSESKGEAKLRAADRSLPFLFNPNVNDADYKDDPLSYRAELHRRLTDWFFPVIFALISIALAGSAHSHRERNLHPLLPALIFGFAFRWASFYFANRIESPGGQPWQLYCFVFGSVLFLILAIYRNGRRLSRRKSIFDSLEALSRLLFGRKSKARGAAQ
jgi:lipopolysaccharide export system permease protein